MDTTDDFWIVETTRRTALADARIVSPLLSVTYRPLSPQFQKFSGELELLSEVGQELRTHVRDRLLRALDQGLSRPRSTGHRNSSTSFTHTSFVKRTRTLRPYSSSRSSTVFGKVAPLDRLGSASTLLWCCVLLTVVVAVLPRCTGRCTTVSAT